MVRARHSFGWKTCRISPGQLLAVVPLPLLSFHQAAVAIRLRWGSQDGAGSHVGCSWQPPPAPAPPEPLSTTIPGAPSPWCVDAGRAAAPVLPCSLRGGCGRAPEASGTAPAACLMRSLPGALVPAVPRVPASLQPNPASVSMATARDGGALPCPYVSPCVLGYPLPPGAGRRPLVLGMQPCGLGDVGGAVSG